MIVITLTSPIRLFSWYRYWRHMWVIHFSRLVFFKILYLWNPCD